MNQTGDLSFVPPPPGQVSGDIGELERPATYLINTDPLAKNPVQVVPLDRFTGNKQYAGMYWARLQVGLDSRGGFRQVGQWNEDSTKRADGGLIASAPGYLCLPTLISDTSLVGTPLGNLTRIWSASIFGAEVYAGEELGTQSLWQETSSTNPTPLAVPSFAAPAGAGVLLCLTPIQVNGVPYLAVGYSSAAANSLQIISSISAFASTTVPVGIPGTCGVIQTPIDGNALLVYQYIAGASGAGQIRAVRTDVAAGSVTMSAIRSTLNGGGYAVGLSAWEGEPAAYWCEPIEGDLWGPGFTVNPTASDKCRLIRTDLRGYLPSSIDTPLRWVTFATKVRGGIVVCDRFNHWFLAPGRKFMRMSVFDDFPANSNITQICCGHATKNGRFLMEVNDVRVNGGSAGQAQRYLMDWDFDLWEPSIVSKKENTTLSNIVPSGSGAYLPWSPYSGYVTTHTLDDLSGGTQGKWHFQFQEDVGQNLWNMRHTSGSAAGSGVEFEASESYTTPILSINGYEDCQLALLAATAPRASMIAEGGTGAYVLLEELQTGLTGRPAPQAANGRGLEFHGTEPHAAATGDRAERQIVKSLAWAYGLQFRVTLARTTTDDLFTHFSPNGSPIFVEVLMVRKPTKIPIAQALKALDAQRGDS